MRCNPVNSRPEAGPGAETGQPISRVPLRPPVGKLGAVAGHEINVLYVAGASRSGSTLLGRLLGAIPGHVDLGETRHLFSRGMGLDRLCSCGERFGACDFWSRVAADAFGPVSADRIREMVRMVRAGTRLRRAVRTLLCPSLRPGRPADRECAALYERLLRSVHRVSGAKTLIDTSKVPGGILTLAEVPRVRLSVIEIVRDPRAVAFSWRRRVARPEIPGGKIEMERLPVWRSAVEWNLARSLLAATRRRLDPPWTILRLEDLVRAPAASLRGALLAIGRPEPDLGFLRGGTANLPAGHSVSGNPMRFSAGPTVIRPDEEWRRALPPFDRSLVTAICRAGLARHGYLASGGTR